MLKKRYDAQNNEKKWLEHWKEKDIYGFTLDEREVYSIDTPPPTVNGHIHIGHIFSYSQAEMMARYKRLRGYNVFYPFGFDDNGLPSERLVEKEQGQKAHQIGREKFLELCYETTDKYESSFKGLFQRLGVSADLNNAYKTVSPSTIKISQRSFLDLVHKGACYHKESPALWCNDCLTSIAQAELETKTIKSTFNYVTFSTDETSEKFVIATTRPELLPAIVCVFVNPSDVNHKHLIGLHARIPVVNVVVPILGDEKVDMEKGTGVVMCCTFGDQTDIEWWKKYNLPLKHIFTDNGRIVDSVPNYGGLKIKEARAKIVNDLQECGYLVKIEEIEHEVQVHERCGREVEYAVMDQWFIDIMNHKEDFLRIGKEINWYPNYMYARYEDWVNNIAWDWCISRQRYFGVPFPVWYCKDCGEVIFATEEMLPVNPLITSPHISACPKCGCKEFVPETDVMDTWATSSLTPMINMKYGEINNYEDILKPMSLRTNASEIIRTWDFYTIVKSFYHFGSRPWNNVMISGFVMANKGEKISKSKGNAKVEPLKLLDQYSADIIRYWAASGRLGTDIQYCEETLLRGKKLINKIWNVSKFVELHMADYHDSDFGDFEFFDKWILGKFIEMENVFVKYMDDYEVGLALYYLEKFFWNFCDNYIEIVKDRLYKPEEYSAKARYSGQKTLYTILYKLLQDFSLFFPFVTEEIYHGLFSNDGDSIHLTSINSLSYKFDKEQSFGDTMISIISDVRGEKSKNNVSLKAVVKKLDLTLNPNLKEALVLAKNDFKATLGIDELLLTEEPSAKNYVINSIVLDNTPA